jgi:hypothetical protein
MPLDVVVAFDQLIARQGLTQPQVQTATTRIAEITAFFADANNVQMQQPVFMVGSGARGTMVTGERDIDLMAPVSTNAYSNQYRNDSRAFLYAVRARLAQRYPRSDVGARQVAVVLDFTDIRTEIVPCFKANGNGYVMPNGTGGWMATNPPFHTAMMAAADVAHGLRLKPLVRLLKAWNLVHAQRLRSFHLEMMVKRMWDGYAIGPWPAAVAGTLRVLPTWFNVVDPADGLTRLDTYLTPAARAQATTTINGSAAVATTAEQNRLAGRIADAFERWQIVYRHTFPAYGP